MKAASRAINQEPGVAAGTLARVADVIAALGFHRNDLPRSMVPHGQGSARAAEEQAKRLLSLTVVRSDPFPRRFGGLLT